MTNMIVKGTPIVNPGDYAPIAKPQPHLMAHFIILNKERNTVSWIDGLRNIHEAQCVFLTNVTFNEHPGLCGGAPRGSMSGTIVEDVVGFLRQGSPVQKARYNASYGWNVQRANRAIIEGRKISFD